MLSFGWHQPLLIILDTERTELEAGEAQEQKVVCVANNSQKISSTKLLAGAVKMVPQIKTLVCKRPK